MKLFDKYMCDLDGCSSTNENDCTIVYFPNLELDLCEHHLYLLPRLLKSIENKNEHSQSQTPEDY